MNDSFSMRWMQAGKKETFQRAKSSPRLQPALGSRAWSVVGKLLQRRHRSFVWRFVASCSAQDERSLQAGKPVLGKMSRTFFGHAGLTRKIGYSAGPNEENLFVRFTGARTGFGTG
jgi:hypothetical protein